MTVTIYEVKQNADQTEGRGPMVTMDYFLTEEKAVEVASTTPGVFGSKPPRDHEVWKITVYEDDWESERIWGYRFQGGRRGGYGFIDLRDVPDDPEYQEYLRLDKIYG